MANEIGDSKQPIVVRVSPRLKDILAAIQKEMALKIKKEYNLTELTINGTIASDCLAGRYLKDKKLRFKIRKNGLNSGTLEIL